MNDSHRDFQFKVDDDLQKLVTVQQIGRHLDVTVRFASDVVLSTTTDHIDNVLEPQMRADDHGLTIEWKAPVVRGFDWLTSAKRRRF